MRAALRRGDRELLVEIEINPGRANRVRVNRAPLPRPRELLGLVRTVLFAPEDLALVRGDPTERRRFLDELLVTRTPRLAGVRADYDRVLKQRNALLKTRAGWPGGKATETLDVWDGHLIDARRAAAGRPAARWSPTSRRTWPRAYAEVAGAGAGAAGLGYSSTVPLAGDGTPLEPGDAAADGGRADRRAARAGRRAPQRRARPRDDAGRPAPRRPGASTSGPAPAKGFASHGESWSLALALQAGHASRSCGPTARTPS